MVLVEGCSVVRARHTMVIVDIEVYPLFSPLFFVLAIYLSIYPFGYALLIDVMDLS